MSGSRPDARLVSVVITNYNYGRFLKECIESVLAQDYKPIEVIVVDDGSVDDSREIIDSYAGRLSASFKQNGGQVTAMNHGFALSRGDILIFLDADDYLLPGAVAAHVHAFYHPGVVRSQTYMMVVRGSFPLKKRMPDRQVADGNLRDLMLTRGPGAYVSSPNSGNAWSRGFLEHVFPLPEKTRTIGSDALLMDAAPLFGTIVTLRDIKAAYREHGANAQGAGVPMTLANIKKTLDHRETRIARLVETAAALGYSTLPAVWRASNWRLLTLDYLYARLSHAGRAPGLFHHLKSTFKVRGALKRAVAALAVLGIRVAPTRLSVWLAGRVIQLRYM